MADDEPLALKRRSLQTDPEDMFCCQICHSVNQGRTLRPLEMMMGTRQAYKYTQCADCGTLQIAKKETDPDKLYPPTYVSLSHGPSHTGLKQRMQRFVFRATVAHELNQTSPLGAFISRARPNCAARSLRGVKRQASILDVGCGTGFLIEALAALGYTDLTGADPFIPKPIDERGFKVLKTRVEEMDQTRKFDVIMLHHSFEHMDNPDAVLSSIQTLLRPDGICIVRIPVCDSEAFDKYDEHWVQLDAPRHIFLHTTKGMEILAARHGLKIRKIVDDSTSFQFIGSEQYRRGIALSDPLSYYRPPYKRLLKPSAITWRQARDSRRRAAKSNQDGRGDQRAFYLVNVTSDPQPRAAL